jgi:hypothetical protein
MPQVMRNYAASNSSEFSINQPKTCFAFPHSWRHKDHPEIKYITIIGSRSITRSNRTKLGTPSLPPSIYIAAKSPAIAMPSPSPEPIVGTAAAPVWAGLAAGELDAPVGVGDADGAPDEGAAEPVDEAVAGQEAEVGTETPPATQRSTANLMTAAIDQLELNAQIRQIGLTCLVLGTTGFGYAAGEL